MANGYFQTLGQRVELMLRDLQSEVERGTATGEQRRRNRAILRGFRAATWAAMSDVNLGELELLVRQELGLPLVTKRRRTVPAGAVQTEGE